MLALGAPGEIGSPGLTGVDFGIPLIVGVDWILGPGQLPILERALGNPLTVAVAWDWRWQDLSILRQVLESPSPGGVDWDWELG